MTLEYHRAESDIGTKLQLWSVERDDDFMMMLLISSIYKWMMLKRPSEEEEEEEGKDRLVLELHGSSTKPQEAQSRGRTRKQ